MRLGFVASIRALALLLLLTGPALAQFGPPVTAGGMTRTVCSTPTVTSGSAYTAGDVVGGLITFSNLWRTQAQGAPGPSGILQTLWLTVKNVVTAEFDIYEFNSNPSSSTFTDKAAPLIAPADVAAALPPIKLANNNSALSTTSMTNYGADAIGRARVASPTTSTSDYFVIVTQGTPTFSTITDVTLCGTYLLD